MHSSSEMNDGYLGSGTRLWYSIQKHGKENHSVEILEYLPSRDALKQREESLVNEEMLQDPKCMNLRIGGEGGLSREAAILTNKIRTQRLIEKIKTDPEFKSRMFKNVGDSMEKKYGSRNCWKGRKHSEETIIQMRSSMKDIQKGSNNSQFGTVWIMNETLKISKRQDKNLSIPEGWKKGRKKF